MPLPSQELLDELYARFILNVPSGELESTERMMFVVEEAHWFYEDNYRETDPSLKQLTLKEFTQLVFERCPGMEAYRHLTDEIYKSFQAFKATVPVMGAILLDPTMNYALLAKGYKSNAAWGFPRGKISKDESDSACAVRELIEETGYDISDKLVEEDYIEAFVREQRLKLFIITGVSTDTPFAPHCKGEISAYAWHEVKDLPTTKDEFTGGSYITEDGSRHRFFMVWPFVKKLRAFIKQRRKSQRQQQGLQQSAAAAQQAAERALGVAPAPDEAGGTGQSKKARRRNKQKRSDPGNPLPAEEDVMLLQLQEPAIQKPAAAPIATATTPNAAAAASPWGNFSLNTDAVMAALVNGMAAA